MFVVMDVVLADCYLEPMMKARPLSLAAISVLRLLSSKVCRSLSASFAKSAAPS